MKKLFLLGLILFTSSIYVSAQIGYTGNTNAGNDYSNRGTAFGSGNDVPGQYAFIGGSYSQATGSHSFGFGQSVVSEGTASFALGSRAVATGNYSFAFGQNTNTSNTGTFALGKYVAASAYNSWVIGTGFQDGLSWKTYENSTSNSLAIGFNMLTTPAIFVMPFTTSGTDGYVGIHTDSPTSELDVNGTITTNGFKMPQQGIVAGYVLKTDSR